MKATRKTSALAVVGAIALASVGFATPGGAAPGTTAAVQEHQAFHVRSVSTAEFGIELPAGLAYASDENAVLVAGTRGTETAVARLTRGGDLGARVALPQGLASTLAYDAGTKRLAMLSGSDLVTVSSAQLRQSHPSAARGNVRGAALRTPAGATFDPSGALLVLDAEARNIARLHGSGAALTTTRVALGGLGNRVLRGLATNGADGLTYVGSPTEQRIYGVDGSGTVRSEYDLTAARLDNMQAFTFAPSTDPTDAPATQSLFVADAGATSTGGKVTELALAAPAAVALTPESTVLVQTIDTSQWVPGAPDTSGIAYQAANDRFMVSDSEVEEVTGAGYNGVNLWQTTRTGTVTDTGTTYPAFSSEPTGLDYRASGNTLLVSDDNANAVTLVDAGGDGRHGTDDDVRTTIGTMPFSDDNEDVAYDVATGDIYIVDGVAREVFGIHPGPNGTFGNSDDVWSNFDVEQYGVIDPEGIGYDAANDTLLVVDQQSHGIYELSKAGALLRIFNLRSAPTFQASDLTVAPGSIRPERSNFWIVDRGVDNNQVPTENDGRIYELSVDTSGNTAPVVDAVEIDQLAPKTADIVTATITAHDADNDPLTYRYVWRKNGTQIPGQTGPTLDLSLAGNGDKGNTISVRVVAFDGVIESAPRTSGQVTIVDSVPAFAQDLGDRSNLEGDAVSLSAAAVDPDGDLLTYEASGLPAGLAIDPATGVITGTVAPGATAGSPYATSISVRQGAAPDAVDTFAWTIGVPPPNQPPTVDSVTIDQATPRTNDTLTTTVVAHDPEGAPLTYAYQWTRNSTDITGQAGSTLNLATAGNGDKGDVIGVRVTVSDGSANTGPVNASPVTVANTPPAFNQDLANRTGVEGNAVSLSAAATDADQDVLTYGASGLPAGLSINPSTGAISGTIANGAAASSPYAVSITVTDGVSANVVDTFTWTVTQLNPPPATPTGLSAAVTTRAVNLDWANNTEPDLAGYNVYRSASASGPFTKLNSLRLSASQYTDSSAPLGASFYRVTAVDTAAKESVPATTSAIRRIVFRSVATASAKDSSNVTVSKPSGVAAGDLLLAAVDVRQAPTISAPSGWTLVRTDTNGTALRQAVYFKIATGSEPSSYRWNFSANRSGAAIILAYRGAATTTTVNASSGRANAASTSMVANGVTTTVPNTLLVGFFGGAGNTSVNPPAAMIEGAEVAQNSGQNKAVLETADSLLPSAGATGTRTATAGSSVANIGQLIAIRPSS